MIETAATTFPGAPQPSDPDFQSLGAPPGSLAHEDGDAPSASLFAALQMLARFLGTPVPTPAFGEALSALPRATDSTLPELAALQSLL